jgi:hypothetical protein
VQSFRADYSWGSEGRFPNPAENTYHPGATECFRSYRKKLTKAERRYVLAPGQQCCYDSVGDLITGGTGAGTPDKVGTAIGEDANGRFDYDLTLVIQHYFEDVRPFEKMGAKAYLRLWPPDNKNGCKSNVVNVTLKRSTTWVASLPGSTVSMHMWRKTWTFEQRKDTPAGSSTVIDELVTGN